MFKKHQETVANVRNRDVVTIYYLLTFLVGLSSGFTFAIYALFLLSKGLNLLQINLVNLAFMSGNFLFEVPTGAYADFFGRKKSVMLGCVAQAIALFVYFLSSSMLVFIVAELIAALAYTFMSGALDAWMVDNLKAESKPEVDKIFSKSQYADLSASLTGGLLGAYLGMTNLALPFAAGGVTALIALLVCVFYMNENHKRLKKSFGLAEGIKQMGYVARNSINYGFKHKVVFWLILASIVSGFAFMPLNMFWSPRFNELAGNQVWIMGWVWAGISLFLMFGSFFAKKLLDFEKSYLQILIFSTLLMAIPIIISASSNTFALALMGFLMYEVGRGINRPIGKAFVNKHIPSAQRATILSFDSMIGKLCAASGLVALGWVANNNSISLSWVVSALCLLLLVPIYFRAAHNEKGLDPA